jgi:(1->4)-alpha-D-glucan 1-alpha-D-glucosylmutase
VPDRTAADLPGVTYRLQLHSGFTLDAARGLVPYLAALGVTDCYCSPVFRATTGSTHGYDVSRHTEINPELGGEPAFTAFSDALQAHGLGLILDFVPNHMSNDPHTNEWWRDVLENGPSSPFARFFDIDWDPTKPELKDRLLLPVLSEQYGHTLERGELSLRFERGALALDYGALTIPINPRRAPLVYEYELDTLAAELGADHPALREFLSILTSLRNLPAYTERDRRRILERQREKEVARERLERLAAGHAPISAHIARALVAFNGTPGEPRSFDRLHALLELQPYRLASWRTAADEINYRRFFDINELAGLRVEDPRVFDEIHQLVIALAASGRITGLRLDHIDGLFDPRAYLERLRDVLTAAAGPRPHLSYVVIEKILSDGEAVRDDWPVAGTTGYTFLNEVNGVFVDWRRAKHLLRTYARFTGLVTPFADVAYEGKRLILSTALTSELQVLAHAINRLSEADRRSRDFTLGSIRRALREVVACFPVYRTYVSDAGHDADDVAAVDIAIAAARRRNPAMEASIFDFLRDTLVPARSHDAALDRSRLDVAMRFQQCTAPVQAKGVEDTAYYRYHPLTSINEVGGDPRRLGRTVAAFHDANILRQRRWPGDMLATTTHDTKRSEDARARINVLSELPDTWATMVPKWRRLNAPNRTRLAGGYAPDANDQFLFYQALAGTWPIGLHLEPSSPFPAEVVSRLTAYMDKATKEAKRHTSWINPNVPYEAAVTRFVEQSLTGRTAAAFLASFQAFIEPVSRAGMVNSLGQLVLKIGSPGVADFYQGVELWDQSLVDPDNRRPVDFDHRRRLLAELEPALAAGQVDTTPADAGDLGHAAAELIGAWPDGRIKLFITALGMRLRRSRPRLFTGGSYVPLVGDGAAAQQVIAFQRVLGTEALIVVSPRLTMRLPPTPSGMPVGHEAWGDTAIRLPVDAAPGYRNLLTGDRVASTRSPNGAVILLDQALRMLPVALLWAEVDR